MCCFTLPTNPARFHPSPTCPASFLSLFSLQAIVCSAVAAAVAVQLLLSLFYFECVSYVSFSLSLIVSLLFPRAERFPRWSPSNRRRARDDDYSAPLPAGPHTHTLPGAVLNVCATAFPPSLLVLFVVCLSTVNWVEGRKTKKDDCVLYCTRHCSVSLQSTIVAMLYSLHVTLIYRSYRLLPLPG